MQATAEEELHVALNAHLLSGRDSYRSAGVHQYIRHLLRHLGDVENDVSVTALLGVEAVQPPTDVTVLRSHQDTSQPARRVLWEQLIQPRVLQDIKADLVHGPVFVGPLVSPCPVVVTVHDLSFIRFPQLFRPVNRLYLTVMTRLSARRARRLIAVSEHAASESSELLGVPRERITVVHHGVNGAFRPLPAPDVTNFRERQGLPERFVLFVGTLEPRKNLGRLIEAFARLDDLTCKLVLAGGRGWLYDDLFARVEELELRDKVVFPGYVPNEDLPLWYNAATAVAYPSLYEGFGMPVTEAQACGTPVLTSNTSSLPEAAGDAGLLVDPHDVEDIASGLRQLLTDPDLREEMRKQGLKRVESLSWSRTAGQTIEVYRHAAQ